MSEAFQRLAQNFAPMEKVPGSSLPVNSRQIKSWINELPRGNPSQTAEMLSSSLVSSLAEKLSGTTRLNQLEEVRKVVFPSRKDTIAMTISVIVMVLISSVIVTVMDWASGVGLNSLINMAK